jgi:hypothetical protein
LVCCPSPASLAAASAINDSRKAIAAATARRDSVTQTPSIRSKVSKPFGSACDTINATSALAARWSSRSLPSQPSL